MCSGKLEVDKSGFFFLSFFFLEKRMVIQKPVLYDENLNRYTPGLKLFFLCCNKHMIEKKDITPATSCTATP
ncbi:hypothetical protein Hanom_Chr10g00874341 [Helianthus anomalus]